MKSTDPEEDSTRPVPGARVRRLGGALLTVLAIVAGTLSIARAADAPKKDFALIYGTVWGADNRPAPGVTVMIQRGGDKKPKWERVSDRRGEFAVRVPVGTADYVLFAEVKTGKVKKRIEAKAHIEANERVDVSLHLTE